LMQDDNHSRRSDGFPGHKAGQIASPAAKWNI
jgi:hypothetical protein